MDESEMSHTYTRPVTTPHSNRPRHNIARLRYSHDSCDLDNEFDLERLLRSTIDLFLFEQQQAVISATLVMHSAHN